MFTFPRSCVAVAATAVLCAASWAGASPQPYLELGVKGGLGLAKLGGDGVAASGDFDIDLIEGYPELGNGLIDLGGDLKPGFAGGAYATVHLNDRFGIRLEALYAMKGGQGDIDAQVDVYDQSFTYLGSYELTGKNTMKLSYFEIPLLGVFSFPAGAAGTFDVFAGPEIAFITSAKLKTELTMSVGGESETGSGTVDMSNEVKGTDFGGVLGAGLSYRLDQIVMFGEARWTYGFTNIPDTDEEVNVKNNSFGLMVGIGFPLGGSR